MSTRRSRRAPAPSPTAMIVNFFLDAEYEVASAALELATTLMNRRSANTVERAPIIVRHVAKPGPLVPAALQPPGALTQTLPSTYEEITAPAVARQPAPPVPPAPPAGAPKPRQRAKRSDAGQPRKRPVASQPAPLTGRPPRVRVEGGKTAIIPPEAPELPEQDVPLDFADVDPAFPTVVD